MGKRLGFTDRQKSELKKAIGANLKSARNHTGLKQTHVMQHVWGTSTQRNRISEIENGHREISLYDLLILKDLYGQSLDYICGFSAEPEADLMAGTINHIVAQSRSMVENLAEKFAETMVEHIKPICKDDTQSVIEQAKSLCKSISNDDVDAKAKANNLMNVIRRVESKQSRQQMAVETQMMQIKERLDKEDGHVMQQDMNKSIQYSLPLPSPVYGNQDQVSGIKD